MPSISLADRIHGSLMGAAIGSELSYARMVRPSDFNVQNADDLANLKLEPAGPQKEERGRINGRKPTPFIGVGVQAYLLRQGRATPEDFAAVLKEDRGIAAGVFAWDGVHSTQEVLKEGMNPRISGMGSAPCGLFAASMPAVGIYHFADPDYAYIDGVELASVGQPILGADWAALCAAAIAAAFAPDATPKSVVDKTLKLAHENNKDLFYQLNRPTWQANAAAAASEDELVRWWVQHYARGTGLQDNDWVAANPIHDILPLLPHLATDVRKLMGLLLSRQPDGWMPWSSGPVAPIIAGAIVGALYGPAAFPAEWQKWVEETVAPWLPLTEVVSKRVRKETEIISATEQLCERKTGGVSLLYDKVYGCMLAGAIGNAMGSPVEGQFYWEIDDRHPEAIRTVLDPARLEGEDDNQMAMLLFETYLQREGLPVMARHFGATWKERLNRDHFYPLCMGNAYDLIRAGWDPRITGHWSVVTGSTVMCLEPVGVYHLADPEFARVDATAVAYMYQRGLDMTAAAMLAATVAEALKPDATVDSVCQAALDAAPREPLRTFDERPFHSAYEYVGTCLDIADKYDDVLAARGELYEKCLFYHMIDPLELWGYALAMFKIAKGDVRQAAIGGTNIGRDSDTIAGRAAMLAGTLNGAGGVPAEWAALFLPESLARIERNAKRLADFLASRKLDRLKARQGGEIV